MRRRVELLERTRCGPRLDLQRWARRGRKRPSPSQPHVSLRPVAPRSRRHPKRPQAHRPTRFGSASSGTSQWRCFLPRSRMNVVSVDGPGASRPDPRARGQGRPRTGTDTNRPPRGLSLAGNCGVSAWRALLSFSERASSDPVGMRLTLDGLPRSVEAMACSAVCISYATAAGGDDVGRLVAEALGFLCVDDEIVARAAASGGIDPQEVADEERRKSLAARLVEALGHGGEAVRAVAHGGSAAQDAQRSDDIRALIRETIAQTATRGRVVIVAHAASHVVPRGPGALRVLITASPTTRAQRIGEARALDEAAATREIKRADAARTDYMKRFYDIDAELPTQYDLVVNTDVLSVEQAARLVVQAASSYLAACPRPACREPVRVGDEDGPHTLFRSGHVTRIRIASSDGDCVHRVAATCGESPMCVRTRTGALLDRQPWRVYPPAGAGERERTEHRAWPERDGHRPPGRCWARTRFRQAARVLRAWRRALSCS